MSSSSSFREMVYAVVAHIPPGCVATYGQIALLTGYPRRARQVGMALASTPQELGLPCHRVVNRKGELAPESVFGGAWYQRMLLEEEGITFNEQGHIRLSQHLWQPDAPQSQ